MGENKRSHRIGLDVVVAERPSEQDAGDGEYVISGRGGAMELPQNVDDVGFLDRIKLLGKERPEMLAQKALMLFLGGCAIARLQMRLDE